MYGNICIVTPIPLRAFSLFEPLARGSLDMSQGTKIQNILAKLMHMASLLGQKVSFLTRKFAPDRSDPGALFGHVSLPVARCCKGPPSAATRVA